ncbi:hypothetical protein CEXT_510641 [Caerostris extrusa]|uniref:Uncharacterized protein n=1 Tax=Caerostris extrusa TaxID=172846 RepID=A0AAV4Q3M9_CAEEX|nr:hypothetical protein CEXT_510641 [Caerostris extrusa]
MMGPDGSLAQSCGCKSLCRWMRLLVPPERRIRVARLSSHLFRGEDSFVICLFSFSLIKDGWEFLNNSILCTEIVIVLYIDESRVPLACMNNHRCGDKDVIFLLTPISVSYGSKPTNCKCACRFSRVWMSISKTET